MWGKEEFTDDDTTPESIKARSMPHIYDLDSEGKIDPISNFVDEKRAVVLQTASNDATVPAKNVRGIFKIFAELGLNGQDGTEGQNLKLIDTGDSGHKFLEEYPETMLSFLYDTLGYTPIVSATSSTSDDEDGVLGTFTEFSQREFFPEDVDWDGDENFYNRINGWIYTPVGCEGRASVNCRVHFAFHGCGGNSEDFANTGYNDLAAANNIIMVYPDTKCWDNEGAIDAEGYNTNTGLLQTALKAMIERVTRGPRPSRGDGSDRRPFADDEDISLSQRISGRDKKPNGLVQIEVTEDVMGKLFADFAQVQDPTGIDDMTALAQTGRDG